MFPHPSGKWAKKVRGKVYYFGRWDSSDGQTKWEAALATYDAKIADIVAGRPPRTSGDGLVLRDLVNRFLTTKKNLVDNNELTTRSFADYHQCCARLIDAFGKHRLVSDLTVDDFEAHRRKLAETRGPVSLGNEIQRVRTVFKYAYDQGLIAAPLRYGQSFQKPSAKVLRKERHKNGLRMFQAAELRRIIAAAGVPLKAFVLLGINAGFGNSDCATLPLAALDLKGGWINYPRPKTGIARRCPLWPETVAVLKAAIAKRPAPKRTDAEGLVFVTKYGGSWSKTPSITVDQQENETVSAQPTLVVAKAVDNPLTKEFRKLLNELGLHRPGLGFYALRHTFETIGGGSRDQVATSAIMGHAPAANDMSAVYREQIIDSRLRAVTDHVRNWLLTEGRGPKEKKPRGGWRLE
ncbi:MAG TPA: hypothetical protein VG826_20145 [Pirellulales bacterium]|nr:hypothetical protein [Pirellulales bacterium]